MLDISSLNEAQKNAMMDRMGPCWCWPGPDPEKRVLTLSPRLPCNRKKC
jgi:hypothetical protein